MSQISKCPKVTHVLTYWEASGEVSELSYKSLLYFSSNGSYCKNQFAEKVVQTNRHPCVGEWVTASLEFGQKE